MPKIEEEFMFSVRERIEDYGITSLGSVEAISHMIGAKIEKFNGIKTIQELCEQYISLSLTSLQKEKLEAFFLVHERYSVEMTFKRKICSPSDVQSFMKAKMKHLTHEEFRVVLVNTKNHVIKDLTVSMGSLNASIVHPREAFKDAIKHSAASMILVHNHPSGNTKPSNEDILITKRLVEVGELIGIKILDHLIIGGNDYFSFKENDYL